MTDRQAQANTTSPAPAGAVDVAGLLAVLRRQRDLYHAIRELAERQGALIAAGDPQPLLDLLGQRRVLVQELVNANAALEPWRSRWPDVLLQLTPAEKQDVNQLLERIEADRQTVLTHDDADRRQLEQARAALGGRLSRMTQASKAHNAYTAGPRHTPVSGARFTDRQG